MDGVTAVLDPAFDAAPPDRGPVSMVSEAMPREPSRRVIVGLEGTVLTPRALPCETEGG